MGSSFLPPAHGNIFSPGNTSLVPLGPNEIFTGEFVRVNEFFGVTVYTDSNTSAAFQGFQLQWSDNGVVEDLSLRQSFSSADKFADGRVRARFFRVVYVNGPIAQTFFVLRTLLRLTVGAGSIIKAGTDTPDFADAQVTHAILVAPRLDLPSDLVHPRASGDPFLYVIPPPNQTTFVAQTVFATTFFSPQFDFFGIFGATRRFFTIFNNTIRGNLHIKFGGAASVSPFGYDYKIPPQGTWTLPSGWRMYGGTIFGIWDFAATGGEAHVMEAF